MKIGGTQGAIPEQRSLRYQGEFLSREGVRWKILLLQETDTPYPVVGEFCFPADSPLVIEWKEVDKLEPVQASCATLTVVSKVDRQYIDLYTVDPGSVLLEVYRNGALYWCGTMDTELYEEPFSYEKEYEVSMTFSDFAILERFNFSGSDICTLEELLTACVKNACLSAAYLTDGITSHVSTSIQDIPADSNIFRELCLYSENFYDEEEEPMTQREVLDEVLRPFALRLVQRCGGLHLYDLNAFQTAFKPQTVEWAGTDAVLGVDNVYKNVDLSFSPYERTTLFKKEVEIKSFTAESFGVVRMNSYDENYYQPELSFHMGLYQNNEAASGLKLHKNARIYQINALASGDESQGIAWCAQTDAKVGYACTLQNKLSADGTALMTFNKKLLIPNTGSLMADSSDLFNLRSGLTVKISLPLLLDGRYNPFEDAGKYNSQNEYDYWKKNVHALYVPAEINLLDSNGKIAYSYMNIFNNKLVSGGFLANGNATSGMECVFSYLTGDGTQGWDGGWKDCCTHTSRMAMAVAGDIQLGFVMAAAYTGAMYLNLPPNLQGHTLEIKIKTGIYKDSGVSLLGVQDSYSPLSVEDEKHARWVLYKMPEIEFVDGYRNSIDTKDIGYTSWLNRSAREKLELDTVVGCGIKNTNDRGLGVLMRSATLAPMYEFIRQGTTLSLEKLLIGTVYSNYHRRMNVLSGTVKLLSGIGTYTDRSAPGTYVLLSDVQDLIADESGMKMVEVEPDNYEGVEYEETI